METKLKFSEALRLGATKYPKCNGTYFKRDYSKFGKPITGCCAIGAALIGLGVDPDKKDVEQLDDILFDNFGFRPTSGSPGVNTELWWKIANLNDSRDDLTFGQIADILEKEGL